MKGVDLDMCPELWTDVVTSPSVKRLARVVPEPGVETATVRLLGKDYRLNCDCLLKMFDIVSRMRSIIRVLELC